LKEPVPKNFNEADTLTESLGLSLVILSVAYLEGGGQESEHTLSWMINVAKAQINVNLSPKGQERSLFY
jgi:hypothetical protein